ncbi:Hypothetical protein SSO1423 [Saccharolobus solfataricus P2]|uniref:Transcription regulator TrmB N-terminal domain-containing protein n=2 Tax=Saccharolobus solfataricus TaxID=2287 RepID=Q97YA9_SACS2|nr:helix-turn-helix domain-containing protein [Saccharolobus solfataricus]AAK41657.1 Hypothetical protein SSO1423 [Saccharolobus solfataricus P2]SAI85101.1 CRISPR-associated CasRA transcriptional regulator [Saccharolobus solfataricus]
MVYLNYEIENYTRNVKRVIVCGDVKGFRLRVNRVEVIDNCLSLDVEGIAESIARRIGNSKDSYVVLLNGNSNKFAAAMFYLFSIICKRVKFVIYDRERVELDGDVFRKVEIDDKMITVLGEIMNGRYKIEEIEKDTGISKATISRVRRKLEEMGLVKKVDGGKYCISERGKIVVYDGGFFRNVKKGGRYYESKTLYTERV